MSKCQIMLSNGLQCTNPAWATNEGVDYCRLHFSYMLAQTPDPLFNPAVIDPKDQEDLNMCLAHKEKARQLAQEGNSRLVRQPNS